MPLPSSFTEAVSDCSASYLADHPSERSDKNRLPFFTYLSKYPTDGSITLLDKTIEIYEEDSPSLRDELSEFFHGKIFKSDPKETYSFFKQLEAHRLKIFKNWLISELNKAALNSLHNFVPSMIDSMLVNTFEIERIEMFLSSKNINCKTHDLI